VLEVYLFTFDKDKLVLDLQRKKSVKWKHFYTVNFEDIITVQIHDVVRVPQWLQKRGKDVGGSNITVGQGDWSFG
jgi:hypothetical protein